MKIKKYISKAVPLSLIIVIFIIIAFYLNDFVEYTDPENGISYKYDSYYFLSSDDPKAIRQIRSDCNEYYSTYKVIFDKQAKYVDVYPYAQYYCIRTLQNELDIYDTYFAYFVPGKIFGDTKQENLTDSEYDELSNHIELMQEKNFKSVIADKIDKTLTFGDNEYVNFKFYVRDDDHYPYRFIYQYFLLQLDDGNVVEFVLCSREDTYDDTYTQVSEVLASFKAN